MAEIWTVKDRKFFKKQILVLEKTEWNQNKYTQMTHGLLK